MGFLDSSYTNTMDVKRPGHKKIFCILSDTLVNNHFPVYLQVFTVNQIRPILQFFYFWSDMIFKLIDRWSEMILTTDVRPWLPRFTLISPNWLLICALTVFEIKIDFWFIIPCSKCPWYQYWCALQQYLMSILGITFPCQFRCSSRLAWFNLEISAIIMHLFSSTFHF